MEGELAVNRPVLSALLGCLVCVCGGLGDGLRFLGSDRSISKSIRCPQIKIFPCNNLWLECQSYQFAFNLSLIKSSGS